jgi:hypothetical protein
VSDTQPAAGPDQWASVVYGRTLNADIWWRALPESFDRTGREADAVLAAIGGGRALSRSPRFVLARRRVGTLVGVVCQASELSPDMNSDGRRPLFCFVGWFCADAHVRVPQLAAMEEDWRQWAAEDYQRWMGPAWNAHPSKVRMPSLTSPETPPWQLPGSSPGALDVLPEHGYAMLSAAPGQVRVHPSAERAWVWQAVARYGRDTALVTGWASARDAMLDGVTDICADDVFGNEPLLLPAPRPARGVDKAIDEAPAQPEASTLDPPPGSQRDEKAGSGPGHRPREPRNLDVLRIRERAERFLHGDAGRDFPPPPDPPPPPVTHSTWMYEQRHHAFYSQVGGFLSCWNGYQLFRWDRDHWVAQTLPPGTDGEPSFRGERATASGPVPSAPVIDAERPSAAKIERLSTGFGEFDQAPPQAERLRPASDQYNSSCESEGESKDS